MARDRDQVAPTGVATKGDATGANATTRRLVTVAFSDLSDSTQLGHRQDPEVLSTVLEQLKQTAQEVVPRFGGIVNQFYGDGVMSIFGLPSPGEDDPRRAVEAILELHRAVHRLPLGPFVPDGFVPRLHSGIHAGLVVVRAGDPARGWYELVGDPTNTAAGLCAHARVDEILVSEATVRGVLPYFDAEEIDALRMKGKAEPLRVFWVKARSAVTTRYEARRRSGLASFIGRDPVLARLGERLEEARRGRLVRAALVGEPGIGKTRTLEEFLHGSDLHDCSAYRGTCESEGRVAPLEPFQRILEQIFGLEHDELDEVAVPRIEARLARLELLDQAPALLGLLGLQASSPSKPSASDAAKGHALVELLLALAARRPLVLAIDDWQWVDDASRRVVASLIEAASETQVLLLTASREVDPADLGNADVALFELEPFDEAESREAVAAALPSSLDPGVAAEVHQRSGGNPLFVEEMCRALAQSPHGVAADEVPVTLQGLIEARLHRLPPEQAELVRTAAVIGNVIPAWLLDEVSGRPDADVLLRQLALDDFIHADGSEGLLRFKHGTTREVVYQSVGLAARQALHARIVQALEARRESAGNEPLEELAYHCAGAAEFEKAHRYAEAAGDRAMAEAATDRVRHQYRAALAALDRLEPSPARNARWLEINKRLSFASVFSPEPGQLDNLRRATGYARELRDEDALGHATFWLGFLNFSLGRQVDAIFEYQRGLRIAEQAGLPKLAAQLRASLGEALAAACEYHEALVLLEESAESKRQLRSGAERSAPTGFAYSMSCKACVLADRGDFEQADALLDQAIKAMEGSGNPVEGSIRSYVALARLCQGRWKECLEAADFVRQKGEQVNGPYLCGRGRSEAAFAQFMLTGDRAFLDSLAATTAWLEVQEMRLYTSLNHGCLAQGFAAVGEAERCRRHAEAALERAQQRDRFGEGMAHRALAVIASRFDGDQTAASRHLERSMHAARAKDSQREVALTQLTQAELYLEWGRDAAARELLEEARAAFQQMGMVFYELEAEKLAELL